MKATAAQFLIFLIAAGNLGEACMPNTAIEGNDGFEWLPEPKMISLVWKHSSLRGKIKKQFKLGNMKTLKWSADLEKELKKNPNIVPDCNGLPDDVSLLTERYTISDGKFASIARSIEITANPSTKWDSPDRVDAYNPSTGECKGHDDKYCWPYKQMIWPQTTAIECGRLKCDPEKKVTTHVICYYAPAIDNEISYKKD